MELQKVEEEVGSNADDVKQMLSDPAKLQKYIDALRREMKKAAKNLEFEEAGKIRDQISTLEEAALEFSGL